MKGDRPAQPHMAAYWDAAQEVGRTDVTAVVESTIEEQVEASRRFYPDLYAHLITAALIEAGLVEREVHDATDTGVPSA